MKIEQGHTYPFVLVTLERNNYDPCKHRPTDRSGCLTPTYIPWLHNLLGIGVRMLTCESVHDVPYEYGDENKKDSKGFIMSSTEQILDFNTWHIDYPRCAGTADGMKHASLFCPKDTPKEIIQDLVNMELATYMVDACGYIRKVLRGAHDEGLTEEQSSMLKSHAAEVIQAVVKASGGKITVEPFMVARRTPRASDEVLAAFADPNNTEVTEHTLAAEARMDADVTEYQLPGWFDVTYTPAKEKEQEHEAA